MKFNLLLCVFLFMSCVKNTNFESKGIAQHIIDVDLVNKEKEIYASSIFESVRAIILEETDDAVI
ncbi:MAG: hypothetical protein LBF59_01285, partial [Prevotellaceae bacterium]|nr:hypothetical protein [Prevotellaceae bacterium]